MSTIINFSDIEPQPLLPSSFNTSPLALTSTFQNLTPNHILNVQSATNIALWLHFENLIEVTIRVLATNSLSPEDFYAMPLQTILQEYVRYKPSEIKVFTGAEKIIVNLPLSEVINFCKIEIKGTANLLKCSATINGKNK